MVAPTVDLPANGRVLLVRLSALGDVLFAMETLSALHAERPDLRIDFLVEDRFAAILEGHPQVHRLWVFPRRNKRRILGHLLRMRGTRYDVVLDLHGILKSSLQVLLLRARLKVGYAAPGSREGAGFAYHRRVRLPDPLPHRADRGFHLLRALGLPGEPRPPLLPRREGVADVFGGRTGPRVVLHPGTSLFAAFKRWPIERFAALAEGLTARGCAVAMTYGPGEAALFDVARQRVPALIGVDGGTLGLLGLAEVMRQADVVVAADTGPLHIAAAAGTRVVALFGPKDPRLYGPRGAGNEVLFHDVPCRPCKLRDCVSPQCVLGIQVAEVERSVLRLTGS